MGISCKPWRPKDRSFMAKVDNKIKEEMLSKKKLREGKGKKN